MADIDFDPLHLTAAASLNHVRVEDVGRPDLVGARAEDLCSRDALHALAVARGLSGVRRSHLSDDILAAVRGTDVRARRSAHGVLTDFGHRLGAVIATLRHPGTADRQARSGAHHAFLAHWTTVGSVWLAGGLLAGTCGRIVRAAAGSAAAAYPCPVELTPYPVAAPLVGVARRAGTMDDVVTVVADLGHTSVRTAVASRTATELTGLTITDARPAPRRAAADDVVTVVGDALSAVLRRAAPNHRFPGARIPVLVSVAAHVARGAPVDDGAGVYGCLAPWIGPLRRRLVSVRGIEVELEFVHDGTAAAATSGSADSATITAGTWLGAGFRPSSAPPLLALAPGLRVLHG